VLDDDLATIASGPTVPDPTTYGEALEVLDDGELRERLPEAVVEHLEAGARGEYDETPDESDASCERATRRLIVDREDALDAAEPAVPPGTPLGEAAAETYEMAESYLADGQHFREKDDPVNALASFSYGYGWLDAGVRLGLFEVPADTELFTTEAP
jgi:hypothetical protein